MLDLQAAGDVVAIDRQDGDVWSDCSYPGQGFSIGHFDGQARRAHFLQFSRALTQPSQRLGIVTDQEKWPQARHVQDAGRDLAGAQVRTTDRQYPGFIGKRRQVRMHGPIRLALVVYGWPGNLKMGSGEVARRIPGYGQFRLGERCQEQDEIAGKGYSLHGGEPCSEEISSRSSRREKPVR